MFRSWRGSVYVLCCLYGILTQVEKKKHGIILELMIFRSYKIDGTRWDGIWNHMRAGAGNKRSAHFTVQIFGCPCTQYTVHIYRESSKKKKIIIALCIVFESTLISGFWIYFLGQRLSTTICAAILFSFHIFFFLFFCKRFIDGEIDFHRQAFGRKMKDTTKKKIKRKRSCRAQASGQLMTECVNEIDEQWRKQIYRRNTCTYHDSMVQVHTIYSKLNSVFAIFMNSDVPCVIRSIQRHLLFLFTSRSSTIIVHFPGHKRLCAVHPKSGIWHHTIEFI